MSRKRYQKHRELEKEKTGGNAISLRLPNALAFLNNEKILIALIFGIAITLRIIYFFQIKGTVWRFPVGVDARIYDDWAQTIVHSGWLGKEVFFMNPGYPYLLAVIYKIFGCYPFIIGLIQLVLGALGCVIIYFIGRKLFSKPVGLIAGLMYACYGISFFYEGSILTAFPITFINLCMLLTLLIAFEKVSYKYWVIPGIFLGISILFRPNILLFIPFVLVGIWLLLRDKGVRKVIFYGAIFCLGIFLIILPVVARNYIVGHQLVLTTSSMGPNFYVGNNPEADGLTKRPQFVLDVAPTSFSEAQGKEFRKEASKRLGRQVSFAESSKYWLNEGLKFIKQSPGRWIKLEIKKFVLFWNAYEVPSNISYSFIKKRIKFLSFPWLSFGIVCPLGILGLLLSIKQWQKLFLFYIYIGVYLVSNMIFFVLSEYRFPIVSIITIFAAYAIHRGVSQIRRKKYTTLSFILLSAPLFFCCVNNNAYGIRSSPISKNIIHHNLGMTYYNEKMYDEAIEEFGKALVFNSQFAPTYITLGETYENLGKYDKANSAYKKAIEIDPANVIIYNELGCLYMKEQLYIEAIKTFIEAIKVDSERIEPYKNLSSILENEKSICEKIREKYGQVGAQKKITEFRQLLPETKKLLAFFYKRIGNAYAQKGEFPQAIAEYEKCLTLLPAKERVLFYNNLGALYTKVEEYNQAIEMFKRALAIEPNEVRIRINLGNLYYRTGDKDAAIGQWEIVSKINPENEELKKIRRKLKIMNP